MQKDLFEKKKLPKLEFSKSVHPEQKLIVYRLIVDGKITENEIKLSKGSQYIYLHEMHFAPEMRQHVSATLDHIVEQEQISKIVTRNLEHARILFECGFRTKSERKLSIQKVIDFLQEEKAPSARGINMNYPGAVFKKPPTTSDSRKTDTQSP